MNEAVRWVMENSRVQGSLRMVLMVMAVRADGCLALGKLESLRREVALSRRQMIRVMADLLKKKEVERLQSFSWTKPSAFHLRKFCARMGDIAGRSHRDFRCSYLAYSSEGYRHSDKMSHIAKHEMSPIGILLPEMVESIERAKRLEQPIWKQEVSEAEIDFMGRQLRQRLGIPVRRPEDFQLEP